ncbi:hypothetical protein [uncultured Flavobacterium sp.]|uniref:hypothetical protein n=1 Tax=uncultured Flavobacterium sp. TaxID=165435 RepID=UPI00260EC235|nr:hypothetical protein [uncultured Flavobacterium sp.]
MKYINLKILIIILCISLIFISCKETNNTNDIEETTLKKENELLRKENELLRKEEELNQKIVIEESQAKQSERTDNLNFLKTLNGIYPNDVKLLENSSLTQRLKILIGNERYNFLIENWATEIPMVFSNNIFVTEGCQAHNCSSTNFIIVYDFSKDIMYAGIREEENIQTFSEDGSNSIKINEWKK